MDSEPLHDTIATTVDIVRMAHAILNSVSTPEEEKVIARQTLGGIMIPRPGSDHILKSFRILKPCHVCAIYFWPERKDQACCSKGHANILRVRRCRERKEGQRP